MKGINVGKKEILISLVSSAYKETLKGLFIRR